jgi:predicted aspartyl protease
MTPEEIEQLAAAMLRLQNGTGGPRSSDETQAQVSLPSPKPFDVSNPRSWQSWIKTFERYRSASGLTSRSEQAQIDSLLYCMGQESEEQYNALRVRTPNNAPPTYADVKTAFDEFYKEKKNLVYERCTFLRRGQLEGESVEVFIAWLYKQAEKCDWGNLRDDLICLVLVIGMRDEKLSVQLQMDSELKLQKAIDTSKQRESVQNQQSSIRSNDSAKVEESSRTGRKPGRYKDGKPRSQNGGARERCERCRLSGHNGKSSTCPALRNTCFVCRERGHFKGSRLCKQKQSKRADVVESDYSSSDDDAAQWLEADYVCAIHDAQSTRNKAIMARCSVNNQRLKFKVDTGSDETIVGDKHAERLGLKLSPTCRKFQGPGQTALTVLGVATVSLKHGTRTTNTNVYVIKDQRRPLLGLPAIKKLQLIQVNVLEEMSAGEPLPKNFKVFGKLGVLKDPYSIKMNPGATGHKVSVARRVPFPLRAKLKKEIDRMLADGVVRQVTEPTQWCSPIVLQKKNDGRLRVCVDYTQLNKEVQRELLTLPSVDETLAQLSSSEPKIFTKLDTKQGFWQIPLDESSKKLTTFICPFGRFQFNRLPFGIKSAPEHFQRRMREILDGLEGVISHSDDILISGSTREQLQGRTEACLSRLQQHNVTLNEDKCQHCVTTVKFLGHIISADGIRPDPEKTRAIKDFPTPTNVDQVRTFLGMVTYLAKFIPGLSDEGKPIRDLLSKKAEWNWGPDQQAAFERIKIVLSREETLAHYDPNKELRVSADASSTGLGAVLEQHEESGWRPVLYASRTLSATEQRYAQIEKEALAITWACERFYEYIHGLHILIRTDHKPLIPIMSEKPMSELSARLQRFRMRLATFDFGIEYTPGKDFFVPDALSRAALPLDKCEGQDVMVEDMEIAALQVLEELPCTDQWLNEVRDQQARDPDCSVVREYIVGGWPRHHRTRGNRNIPLYDYRSDLVLHDDVIMYGRRVVIPKGMQAEMLRRIHSGHLGITKCKARARGAVWWPGIMGDVKCYVEACSTCAKHRVNRAEPMIISEMPARPWQVVALDFCMYEGKSYLVLQDYFSRYLEVVKMSALTSAATIRVLKGIFASHGTPEKLVTDCGPQLTSQEFTMFASEWGFRIRTSSPEYHQANGLAEKAVGTVKRLLAKNSCLEEALLAYRSAPLANGFSPAQLLFGRQIRTRVPCSAYVLSPRWPNLKALRAKEVERKNDQKLSYDKRHGARSLRKLQVGEKVWVVDVKREGVVVRVLKEMRSYCVETSKGRIRRNRRHLVPLADGDGVLAVPGAGPSLPEVTGPTVEAHNDPPVRQEGEPPASPVAGEQPVMPEAPEPEVRAAAPPCARNVIPGEKRTGSGRLVRVPQRLIENI